MADKRIKAYRRGHRAETLACWALRLKGYRIMARRHRTKLGEIDIIARKGTMIAFVEVKARQSEQSVMDSVSYHAQRRIEAAAESWLAKQPDVSGLSWRFDVVAVLPRRWPIHHEDVW